MAGKTFASRTEQKYLLTPAQMDGFMEAIPGFLQPDEYGETTVCNLYLDTPDDDMVRISTEKPTFKQKVRIRSYGIPEENTPVYGEIKKKLKGTVYKRRAAFPLSQVMDYLYQGRLPDEQGQVFREIHALVQPKGLLPRTYLAYDRTAYLGGADGALRVTVDRNIRYRRENLDLTLGDAGHLLLPPGTGLIEIKSQQGLPRELCRILNALKLQPASFSKIGQVYKIEHTPHFIMERKVVPCLTASSPLQAAVLLH